MAKRCRQDDAQKIMWLQLVLYAPLMKSPDADHLSG